MILPPRIALVIFIAIALSSFGAALAQNKTNLFSRARTHTAQLFGDQVVARGKGFEVMQSEVDDMYLAFKGHRAAIGQGIPDAMRPRIEADILDKLIATRLFLRRATEQDKAKAKEIAETFIAEQKKQVPTEDSFRRQLIAVGMSPEEFSSQIHEQAVVKAVIDREIKTKKKVTEDEARKFYNENPSYFEEPELVRASHILISTRDSISGKDLTPELKLEKKRLAEKALARARAGEDFAKLVKEFSEDSGSKSSGGEYTFPRAKDDPRRAMVPEFEAAAFSMAPGKISELVETRYGYHIIKTLQKIPAKKTDYALVAERIKDSLVRQQVEKELPEFIEKLRKEAGVEIVALGEKK